MTSVYAPSLRAAVHGELSPSGLALFRGIPYATLEKRWAQSRPLHQLASPFNAKSFGPRCPQGVDSVLVRGIAEDATPGDDEFKCLNLNVTVPQEHLASASLLPVMVWIHGGAFSFGANSVGRYRPEALCDHLRSVGRPVVLVQINYRLGPLGFAMSGDLRTEQQAHAEPYLGNFGFIDQQNALRWVQEHIRDFGGDPGRVTAFGVSAGSASVHYHILSGQPLFDQAIMMSGTAGNIGPLPFSLYEKAWQDLSAKHSVGGLDPAARLTALRALSTDELIASYSRVAMGPYGDGKLLPETFDYTDEGRESRCKRVVFGDTRVEGIVVDHVSKINSQDQLAAAFRSIITDSHVFGEFCSVFGFTKSTCSLEQGNMPADEYRDAVRLLLSVGLFQFPTLRVAETFASKQSSQRTVFLYHFEENSPYPGPTLGLSYHGMCALYLYLQELAWPAFPETAATTSRAMAATWAAFVYGEAPWAPFDPRQPGADRFMRWGPDGCHAMFTMAEDDTRPYQFLPWVRKHPALLQKIVYRLLH